MLIYIVEDDDNIRELEAFAMKNSGYDTECFASSKGFYQAITKAVPDLILLDIMLPGDDGLAILSKLRDDPVNDEQKEKASGHRHDLLQNGYPYHHGTEYRYLRDSVDLVDRCQQERKACYRGAYVIQYHRHYRLPCCILWA